MVIPLVEVPSRSMGAGEERHYFLFHQRNPDLPVEIVITRLPPRYSAERNWHKHDFIEEFSVPLLGEIVISEKNGKVKVRKHSQAILSQDEWVIGISCNNDKEAVLHIESASGVRRDKKISFDPKFTEGKNWHKVENLTNDMVTFVTMKRVPKKILKKDPLIFSVDRTPPIDER